VDNGAGAPFGGGAPGPVGDAGAQSASGDAGGGPTPPATCDYTGTWATRITIDVAWAPQGLTGIVLAPGTGTIRQWTLGTRAQSGSTLSDATVVCGVVLPDFQGTAIAGSETYAIRFPDALFDDNLLPQFIVHGTMNGTTYTTSPVAALLGVTLGGAPQSAAWPPQPAVSQVDMDQDGQPGVTANALATGTYSYPPLDVYKTQRADKVYVAIRQVTQINATASDCDHMAGTASIPVLNDPSTGATKAAIDSHVIGCEIAGSTTACTSTQATFLDNTQPVFTPQGSTTLTSVRVPAGTPCASVRQELP
jgi:hypothetical protein